VKNQYEKKFKALEKAKADALEMAAQANEKGKAKKAGKDQVNPISSYCALQAK
jgi:hypothetical protein